ncbi:NAD(P)-dependent dehydrogenase (short-subunit alcohol dehydrogenase family) [Streptomyces aurantiacus]|uniref:SDR family NAD(P)-dependent oxidoreductase n=1 Tax=Streptomyces aurantiacus TaxID=47760 RepID=UPI00279003D4|nr:SDR family NAD(P)-dependent oxidoreductase [Streptomyces aurantiacus]MDQ0773221.1 NAD(P)-dependent dehydrogenase (short-subunit alcohol dehydrogenase family) [Streptomyces aurantiacus]
MVPTAVVVGAGPGIGKSVADRFAREGFSVAVIARREETVLRVAADVGQDGREVLALTADSTDEESLRAALATVAAQLGPIDAAVYNAALIRRDAPGELGARGQLDAWAVNVVGALSTAAHVAPGMAERGHGSILVTGGMPRPDPGYVSLGLGKFGVRTLVSLLDAEYGPAGVHVASVTVPGAVAQGTAHDPDDIADHYWRLHTQPRDAWEHEVVHGGVPAS